MNLIKSTIDELSLKIGMNISIGNNEKSIKYNIDSSSNITDINSQMNTTTNIYLPFKLPIEYQSEKHEISPIVTSDLELYNSSDKPIYDLLFRPSHEFSKSLIDEWKKYFSTDIEYLKDTQNVIKNMSIIKEHFKDTENTSSRNYQENSDELLTIWKDIKEDENIIEKYSYIEFDYFKYLNYSPFFLQMVTIGNICSPIISFLVPFIFFLLPFIILKLNGIELGYSNYIYVLKDLAKNHSIGKILNSTDNIDLNKIGYIIITIGMYLFQIYNNVVTCIRFHRNVKKINDQMIYLRDFLQNTYDTMDSFLLCNNSSKTYHSFFDDIRKYRNIIKLINEELSPITSFNISLTKLNQVGYMLKCFYSLYSNNEYSDAIRFSFGFEGYINNMMGIFDNLKECNISFCSFLDNNSDKKTLSITEQFYPPHGKEGSIKNNIDIGRRIRIKDKNDVRKNDVHKKTKGIIITGPNASGKTTFLKTTTINIILSQQLGVGYYSDCSLKPYKYIHSYLNIPDTSGRDSLFQSESRRCKEIIDSINNGNSDDNHFCIFDELYSGTNPVEASKASFAFLKYLTRFENVSFILTTHYICVCKKIEKNELNEMVNYRMAVERNSNDKNELLYKYQLEKGISDIEGAITVLKSLNYPQEIINDFIKIK